MMRSGLMEWLEYLCLLQIPKMNYAFVLSTHTAKSRKNIDDLRKDSIL